MLAGILTGSCTAQAAPQPGTVMEETIRWLEMPEPWIVVLVILPLLVGWIIFFYKREKPVGNPQWRWALGALRFLVLALALLMIAQPVRQKKIYETTDSTLVLLVDDSLSQDIQDRYSRREIPEALGELFRTQADIIEGTTRYDLVRRLLRDDEIGFIKKLRKKAKLAVYTFSGSVNSLGNYSKLDGSEEGSEKEKPGAPESGSEESTDAAEGELLPPYSKVRDDQRVQETRVAEGLRDAVSGVLGLGFGKGGEKVSGVIMLSDFQQNADTISVTEFARGLGERDIKVFTIGVGNPDEPKDIRITNVDVNNVVLVDDDVPFDVSVVADGYEGDRVRVDLRIDSVVVDTSYILLEGGGKRQGVRFIHQPRKPGKMTATVEVEQQGGEVFYDNNSFSRNITVLDQKIKVLYAEYLPRWEYRYLKNALIRDKTMETQIFLFSADPEFTQDSSPGVPALNAFPSQRDELFKYHVVILGDVDPEGHLGTARLELLKEFVAAGGGVVFLSGPHHNPSRYPRSADLYTLLPVQVSDAGRLEGFDSPVTKSFNVKLSAVGREHPVMRLDNDSARNLQLWENEDGRFYDHLPGFFWFASVGRAKGNAVVLAQHPELSQPLSNPPKPLVIFAFMNYGKGRTFFSAVDNTWRWRAGVDNLHFYRFWGQVCRFVAAGRLLGKTPRYTITSDKELYTIGESVRVECQVYDANMNPSEDESTDVYHQVQGGVDEAVQKIDLALHLEGQGVYRGTISAGARGRHDIWLGTPDERFAFTSYTVEVPALEARDTRLNRTLGEQIAELSGGEYFDFSEVMNAAEKVQGLTQTNEGLVEDDNLWDEWWVVVLITAVLAIEWILRKAVRLV